MKDLYNNIVVQKVTDPVSITHAINVNVEADLVNFNSCVVLLNCGAAAGILTVDNRIDLKLTHADDTGAGIAGNYAAVELKDVLGVAAVGAGGTIFTLNDNAKMARVHRFGYVGGKRFIKVALKGEGTVTAIVVGTAVIKGHPLDAPTS